MEQERANGNDIDDSAISGVKVGLMGPLAGVGDPIFWGTLRPVLAALGAGLAITGSLLGPLLFFIGINLCRGLTVGMVSNTAMKKVPPSLTIWAVVAYKN